MLIFFLILAFFRLRPAFLKKKIKFNKNIFLFIAHPDDETMFFSPLLYHNKPFIYCLSSNKTRNKEFKNFCKKNNFYYKIDSFIDNENWDSNKILKKIHKKISKTLKNNKKISLITFDKNGASGHKNHKSCYEAIKKYEKIIKTVFTEKPPVDFYYLKTLSIFEKYVFNFEIPNIKIPLYKKLYGVFNMMNYKSQITWYRMIYIFISNYMMYNTFN